MRASVRKSARVAFTTHPVQWWRRVAIVLSTLILCSCSELQIPLSQSALTTAILADGAVAPGNSDGAGMESSTQSKARTDSKVQQAQFVHAVPSPSPVGAVPSAPALPCVVCTPLGPGDEYLCDGGDFGSPAGVRADWTIEGLEQEDAIAHYDTLDGRVIVAPSNRVCIYAPRFAAVRQVTNPMGMELPQFINEFREDASLVRGDHLQPVASAKQRHAIAIDAGKLPPSLYRQRQQAGGLENLEATMEVYTSLAAYANLQVIRFGQLDGTEQAKFDRSVRAAITWTGDQAAQVVFGVKAAKAEVGIRQAGVIYQTDEPDSPRLRLIKLASAGHALPGEEVEFTLRYDNVGDQVIGNVTIVDNLATRLEYVPDSARSTANATFRIAPNSAGSTILRWEVNPPLEPGQGGVLQFRAHVR
jgi:uncharacterized repeat protein (TIGR01451 family)